MINAILSKLKNKINVTNVAEDCLNRLMGILHDNEDNINRTSVFDNKLLKMVDKLNQNYRELDNIGKGLIHIINGSVLPPIFRDSNLSGYIIKDLRHFHINKGDVLLYYKKDNIVTLIDIVPHDVIDTKNKKSLNGRLKSLL